jgi:branched-chain amino acid aminotransferase
MSLDGTRWIWHNGAWKRWEEATVHVSTHALQYGSTAFEGIRAYETTNGPAIFRLAPHVDRLFFTCKLMRMSLGDLTREAFAQLCVDVVARNGLESCYIRPMVFRGSGTLGLNPLGSPVEIAIFAVEWGRYLGAEGIEMGVDVAISSWRRFNASTAVPLGKIGGQYVTSQFVSIEARQNGFVEGVLLDERGYACEGAGENLFLVMNGALVTPPLASSILAGITRDTVLTLAQDLGVPVRYEPVSRDMLYLADEIFMTGTAAEITPVRSVDRLPVGSGTRGPVTRRLQDDFFGITSGTLPDRHGWLTQVPAAQIETAAASG